MEWTPYVSIAILLVVIFIIWLLWGENPNGPPSNSSPSDGFGGVSLPSPGEEQESGDNSRVCMANSGISDIFDTQTTGTPAPGLSVIDAVREERRTVSPNVCRETVLPLTIPDVPTPLVVLPSVTSPLAVPITTPAQVLPFDLKRSPSAFARRMLSKVPLKDGSGVSYPQRLACTTLAHIYGVPFAPNVRSLPWLRNPETGANLELDCYNDTLKLGLEYNGYQHYQWPNHYPQSDAQFIAQLRRDEVKYQLCQRNKVYLITVPDNRVLPHEAIPDFIISQLPETVRGTFPLGMV